LKGPLFTYVLIQLLIVPFQIEPNEDLVGTYEYEVSIEFIEYFKSTVELKKRNKYVRDIIYRGEKKIRGTWTLKDTTLILKPHNLDKFKIDTFEVGNGFLLWGEIGKHEKIK